MYCKEFDLSWLIAERQAAPESYEVFIVSGSVSFELI